MLSTWCRDFPWQSVPLLGLLVLPPAPSRAAAAELKASQIYAKSVSSVCTVITMASGKPVSLGSGFVVSSGGLVATNRHVVDRATDILVKCGKHKAVAGHVTGPFGPADLALIRTSLKNLRPLHISAENPEKIIGQQVFVIGNPEGLEGTISSGLISGVRSVDGLQVIQISAPISHGSSGGPVILASGAVIGVATAQLTEGQNLNFALPASLLRDLVYEAGTTQLTSDTAGAAKGAPVSWKDIPAAILSRAFWESLDWSNPAAREPFKNLTPIPAYDPNRHQVGASRMATMDRIEFLGKVVEFELLIRDTPTDYPKGFRLWVDDDASPEYCQKMGETLEASLGPPNTAHDLTRPYGVWSITERRRQWDIGPSRIDFSSFVQTPRSSTGVPVCLSGLFAWHQSASRKDQPVVWIRCSQFVEVTVRLRDGYTKTGPPQRVPDMILMIDEYDGAVYHDGKSKFANASITPETIQMETRPEDRLDRENRTDKITIDRRTGSYIDTWRVSEAVATTEARTTGECVPFNPGAKRF